jgi:hypothetical protein
MLQVVFSVVLLQGRPIKFSLISECSAVEYSAVSIRGVQWSWESTFVRQSPASKDVNMEATALEAITGQQPVKTQKTEKTLCML